MQNNLKINKRKHICIHMSLPYIVYSRIFRYETGLDVRLNVKVYIGCRCVFLNLNYLFIFLIRCIIKQFIIDYLNKTMIY